MPLSTQEIGCKQLANQLASTHAPLLVDCRELDEYALCHIEGAILIPLSNFPSTYEEQLTDPDRDIVIYCHHGVRSLYATEFLKDHGFNKVRSLAGGIDQWSTLIDGSVQRY